MMAMAFFDVGVVQAARKILKCRKNPIALSVFGP